VNFGTQKNTIVRYSKYIQQNSIIAFISREKRSVMTVAKKIIRLLVCILAPFIAIYVGIRTMREEFNI